MFVLSFAVGSNLEFLGNDKHSTGPFGMLNGLRVIMMSWVILGHTPLFQLVTVGYDNYMHIVEHIYPRFTFQQFFGAEYAVDVFFLMSGFLVTYLTYLEVKANKINSMWAWAYYYFHRYWRLTPVYMFIMLISVKLTPYMGEGPFWFLYSPNNNGDISGTCDKYWWTNLLYINNFIPWGDFQEGCIGWTWYLANDMQFFCVVPILILAYRASRAGFGVLVVLTMVASVITRGAVVGDASLSTVASTVHSELYARPWSRINPYLIGVCMAFWVVDNKDQIKRLFDMKAFRYAGYFLVLSLTFTNAFGTYKQSDWTIWTWVFFESLSRDAFCVGVGILILACFVGYGGVVHWFLSAAFWNPLAKLTYCAYLIHPVVMSTLYYQQTRQAHYSWAELGYSFLGNWAYSYALALLLHLLIEKPCSNFERIWRSQRKK